MARLHVRDGGVQHQRGLAGPGGVPGAAAHEDHRARELRERPDGGRATLHERLDRPHDQARAPEACLPRGRRRDGRRLVGRGETREVEGDRAPPGSRERGARERAPGRARTLLEVDQRQPGIQPARHGVHLRRVDGDRRGEQRVHDGVRRVVTQEMGGHPVRDAQRPCQRGAVLVLHQQQVADDQRRQGPQAVPVRGRAARARRRRAPGRGRRWRGGVRRRRGGSRRGARSVGRGPGPGQRAAAPRRPARGRRRGRARGAGSSCRGPPPRRHARPARRAGRLPPRPPPAGRAGRWGRPGGRPPASRRCRGRESGPRDRRPRRGGGPLQRGHGPRGGRGARRGRRGTGLPDGQAGRRLPGRRLRPALTGGGRAPGG